MSTSLGIGTAGNFVTTAYTPTSTDIDASYKAAGVTDTALTDKLNQHEDSIADTVKFLNTLTPEQLNEKTVGEFQNGLRVTTYADLKTYDELLNGLTNAAGSLGSDSTVPLYAVSASTATVGQAKAMQAITAMTDLNMNKAGSISEAETYLSSLSSPSNNGLPHSTGVRTDPTTLSSGDIQKIFAQFQSASNEWSSDRTSGWTTASKDSLMSQSASAELIETANALSRNV